MTRSIPARDCVAEAAWLRLGGSICRRAREIAAEKRAKVTTPAEALADLSAVIDRAEASR